jgi:hypothetical protein
VRINKYTSRASAPTPPPPFGLLERFEVYFTWLLARRAEVANELAAFVCLAPCHREALALHLMDLAALLAYQLHSALRCGFHLRIRIARRSMPA